ncbi:MAG: hypothetical protein NE330_19365, partial [Lentisphaeraceae bacterium]|nr:hypothetical protein [Lentisphaeraceae bacterium]
LLGRKVLLMNDSDEGLRTARRIRRWGAKPVFLNRSLISLDGKNIMPEFDDIIFFTPRETSDLYELLEGPKISAECKVISIGEEVDSSFNCLFRRKTAIVPSYRDAVDKLRQEHLSEYVK